MGLSRSPGGRCALQSITKSLGELQRRVICCFCLAADEAAEDGEDTLEKARESTQMGKQCPLNIPFSPKPAPGQADRR